MVQQLGVLTAIPEDPGFWSSTHVVDLGASQLSVTPRSDTVT